jgi:hypothetical protein
MFQNAEEVPSPGRQPAEQEIYPHPNNEQRPVEARRGAGDLAPDVVRKIFPDMAGFLNSRISGKAVIIQDELKRQRGAVDSEN